MLISVFMLQGCSRRDTAIKVGYAACLTGRLSELGVSGRNGAEIAVEEVNTSGGINGLPVVLLSKDDKNDTFTAAKVDKELIDNGCVAIIGHFTSGVIKSALSQISDMKGLMISPTISANTLSGKDDNFIRVIASNNYQADLLARAAINRYGTKRISVLYDLGNQSYTEELFQHFKKVYEASGGKIIFVKTFTSGNNTSFETLAKELTSTKADGILSIAAAADNAMLCQQLHKLKKNVKVYAGMWSMTDDLIFNGGKAVEGMVMPGVFERSNNNAAYVKFRKNYISKYHTEPTFSSVYSYEAAKVLFTALRNCKDHDPASIKKNILSKGRFSGLQNNFLIDKFGDSNRDYFLFTILNGEFVRVN